jgi:hypothetical protein
VGYVRVPRVLKRGPHCHNVLCATLHVQPSLPTVSSRSLALRSTGIHAGKVSRRFGSRRRDGCAGIPATSLRSGWRRRVRFAKRGTRLAEASEAVGVGGAVEPRFGPCTPMCPDMSYSRSTARDACTGSAHRIGISTGASVARSASSHTRSTARYPTADHRSLASVRHFEILILSGKL